MTMNSIWELAAGVFHRAERHRDGTLGVNPDMMMICFLQEDQSEFLAVRRLTDLVKKLSEFIGFPIELHVKNRRRKK